MLYEVFRVLADRLRPVATAILKQEHRIELVGGGSIDFWSMEDGANRCRGRKYADVVLDECAMVPGLLNAWEEAIRPTLTDYAGTALFVSTPRRGGGFQELFEREGDDWASHHITSLENPHLPAGEVPASEAEAVARNMSVQAYRQEYLADFEASESDLVFPEVSQLLHARSSLPVTPAEWRAHVVGIDPGGGDPTAITPIAVWRDESPTVARALPSLNFHQHGEFYRRGDVSSEDIIQYLRRMHRIHPLTKVLVAETGGNVITNTLIAAGFPAERYIRERGGGLETVRWLYQSQRLTIAPDCTNSWAEFPGYKWKRNRDMESGERYATSTPGDNHADAHDARRAALQWAVEALVNGANVAQMQGGQQAWGPERETGRRARQSVGAGRQQWG